MLRKSVLIADLLSCGVKSVLSSLGCEFKFHYYVSLSLDVFLSLSYVPLHLSLYLMQSFVISADFTIFLLVTVSTFFLEINQCFIYKSCLHNM